MIASDIITRIAKAAAITASFGCPKACTSGGCCQSGTGLGSKTAASRADTSAAAIRCFHRNSSIKAAKTPVVGALAIGIRKHALALRKVPAAPRKWCSSWSSLSQVRWWTSIGTSAPNSHSEASLAANTTSVAAESLGWTKAARTEDHPLFWLGSTESFGEANPSATVAGAEPLIFGWSKHHCRSQYCSIAFRDAYLDH